MTPREKTQLRTCVIAKSTMQTLTGGVENYL